MPNIELLEKTMQYIEDHPEQHEQSLWLSQATPGCATAACFAGWACLLDGYEAVAWERWYRAGIDLISFNVRKSDSLVNSHPRELGQALLGLSDADAWVLFYGTNTLDQLKLMTKHLSNGLALADQWEQVADYDPEGRLRLWWVEKGNANA